MTDRISIPALRELASKPGIQRGECGCEEYLNPDLAEFSAGVLALVEAVEAAREVWRHGSGWQALDAALARFDFGEKT